MGGWNSLILWKNRNQALATPVLPASEPLAATFTQQLPGGYYKYNLSERPHAFYHLRNYLETHDASDLQVRICRDISDRITYARSSIRWCYQNLSS